MLRHAGLLNAASCNYGYALDLLLERGYVICIVPRFAPDRTLNEKNLIPDVDSIQWDAWMNGTLIPAQNTWQNAAESAIFAVVSTLVV